MNVEKDTLQLSTGAKKIKISKDEKNLSGAPEGDIYDITVIADENLDPLPSPSLAWPAAINILTSGTTTWAEKHSAIETIRKLSLHHQDLLNEKRLCVALVEATRATGSLRSCICRNGILCLQSLFRIPHLIDWITGRNESIYAESISALMNKSANGPRFICASALAALEVAVHRTPIALLSTILQPSSTHKNAEIANLSFVFVAEQAMRCSSLLGGESDEVLSALLLLLDRGLGGPRPAGREACKKALESITATLEASRVQLIVDTLIPTDRRAALCVLVTRISVPPVVASPRLNRSVGKKPKAQSNSLNKVLARPSFRDHVKLWKTKLKQDKTCTSGRSDTINIDHIDLIL